jgi:hypothetical protein
MRILTAVVAVATGLAMAPARAVAQAAAPKHEFGVDLGLGLVNPSGGSTHIVVFTPVDVRLGFVSSSALSWEGRLTLFYDSKGFGGSNARYSLAPDIQALYRLGSGSGAHGLMGPYATVGAGLDFADTPNGAGGTNSSTVFRLNGGVGTRVPYGSGAFRIEGFVAYDFKNTTLGLPGTLEVGTRLGLSLWH